MKKLIFYILAVFPLILSFLFDKQITLWVSLHRLSFLNTFMKIITYIGKGYIIFILVPFLVRKKKLIIPAWLALGFSLFITYLLKISLAIERPNEIIPLANENSFSFPSGHATGVFSVLPFLKNIKWPWLMISILVAFSRLYLGVHYLSDVIAGSLIGLSVGSFVKHKFFKVYKKSKIQC